MKHKHVIIEQIDNRLFLNSFEILDFLGSGSYSKVYKARIKDDILALQVSSQQQLHQYDILSTLTSIQNIPTYYEKFQICSLQYKDQINQQLLNKLELFLQVDQCILTQTYFEGQHIDDAMFFATDQQVVTTFQQIVQTIRQIHLKNVFHFDLKPENILYNLNTDKYFIIDFGQSQIIDKQTKANLKIKKMDFLQKASDAVTNSVYSTPIITPPLMKEYDHILCEKFDVYSLGCVLFKLLNKKFIKTPLQRQGSEFQLQIQKYGVVMTDLLCGMLDKDQFTRYSVSQTLYHPVFQYENWRNCKVNQLDKFYFEYQTDLHKILLNNVDTELRSFSVCKHKDLLNCNLLIKQYTDVIPQLIDDQNKLIGLNKKNVNQYIFHSIDDKTSFTLTQSTGQRAKLHNMSLRSLQQLNNSNMRSSFSAMQNYSTLQDSERKHTISKLNINLEVSRKFNLQIDSATSNDDFSDDLEMFGNPLRPQTAISSILKSQANLEFPDIFINSATRNVSVNMDSDEEIFQLI